MADIAEQFEQTVRNILVDTFATQKLPNIISSASKQRLAGMISDAASHGARIINGDTSENNTENKSDGNQFVPIIIGNITPSMQIWKDEAFGPVFSIRTVESEQEAVEAANDTTYGLNMSIFTKDLRKAFAIAKQLECG